MARLCAPTTVCCLYSPVSHAPVSDSMTLAIPAEDSDWLPPQTWSLTTPVVPGASDALFWPPWGPGTHVTYMQAN